LLTAPKTANPENREQGYVLLALLLVMAVLAIAATVAAPTIFFQIKRDREEELVHRGIQYRRALRMYATKTGGYPHTLDQLLGNADTRYIRKLYKDPITGGDFRLLHMADVQPGVGVASPDPLNQNGAGTGAFGSFGAGNNGIGRSGLGNASFGANANSSSNGSPQTSNSAASTDAAGSDAANAGAQNNPQAGTANAPTGESATATTNTNSGESSAQPGLLIFGVASKSKDRTIREFYNKNHYNDWWFFYDPRANGYEFKGPTPPPGTPVQNIGIAPQSNPAGTPVGLTPPTTQSGAQPQPQQ
jgi:type II secretory pathway pseudopilin PulG